MTQPPSKAPRKGLITALEGGRSCRAAAWRFGVAASTAIRWFDRWGRFEHTPPGGDGHARRMAIHHAGDSHNPCRQGRWP